MASGPAAKRPPHIWFRGLLVMMIDGRKIQSKSDGCGCATHLHFIFQDDIKAVEIGLERFSKLLL